MINQQNNGYIRITIFIVLLSFVLGLNCARVGLISDNYPESFYRVRNLLADEPLRENPTFLVYGDNQAGWRAYEKFLKKGNWATWKMLLFPFYEFYWLGNGIVGGINWYRRMPDYAGKEQRMVRDAVYRAARNNKVDFILNTGDICAHDGRRPKHWARFLNMNKIEHPLLNEIPYLPVIGNHERANDSMFGIKNYQAIFQFPRFYVIDFPDGALFVVDSNFILDQKDHIDNDLQNELFRKWYVSDPEDDQPSWLEQQLSSRDVQFKIVAMHQPPISFGKHHMDWHRKSFGKDLKSKRDKLISLFEKYNVRLVFSGHDHYYQHNVLFPEISAASTGNEIHFVVGGGGGTPLRLLSDSETITRYTREFEKQGLNVIQQKQLQEYHYSLVTISSDTLSVKVFEATGDPSESDPLLDEFQVIVK
ncbi:MAG: metallophosphoesterase [candidate division Zixibacteria bacterium]